jgi:hypothetical protein
MGLEDGHSSATVEMGREDADLLYRTVRILAEMLSSPDAFTFRLHAHHEDFVRRMNSEPFETTVLEALQLAAATVKRGSAAAPLPLARVDEREWKFRWVYDPAGNRDVEEDWRPYATFAEAFATFLLGLNIT